MNVLTAPENFNVPHGHIHLLKQSLDIFTKDGMKVFGDPRPVYEFLLEHGQEFHGTKWTAHRGKGYRMMKPTYCFSNAWHMAACIPGLTYYEGYATARSILPVHHAWCVDENGLVVDPTWRVRVMQIPENDWEYFGVGFDVHALMSWWLSKGTASILYDLDYDSNIEEFVAIAKAA